MATHSSILAWDISWTEEPGRLSSPWGHKELDMTEQLNNCLYNRKFKDLCINTRGSYPLCWWKSFPNPIFVKIYPLK